MLFPTKSLHQLNVMNPPQQQKQHVRYGSVIVLGSLPCHGTLRLQQLKHAHESAACDSPKADFRTCSSFVCVDPSWLAVSKEKDTAPSQGVPLFGPMVLEAALSGVLGKPTGGFPNIWGVPLVSNTPILTHIDTLRTVQDWHAEKGLREARPPLQRVHACATSAGHPNGREVIEWRRRPSLLGTDANNMWVWVAKKSGDSQTWGRFPLVFLQHKPTKGILKQRHVCGVPCRKIWLHKDT